ncbi:MAG: glycosyltransferase, partial [Muribaculum sp.]|nr:glycosyltransferase [Muribaculum sp.]
SICEALSYGVPVLATDVGGIAEAVTPEVGIVLPPDSCADAFVGEMQPYISFPDDFMYMRKAARKRWVEEFDSEMHSANFANKLKNLI